MRRGRETSSRLRCCVPTTVRTRQPGVHAADSSTDCRLPQGPRFDGLVHPATPSRLLVPRAQAGRTKGASAPMVMGPEPPTATTTQVVDEASLVAAVDGPAIEGRSLGRIAWTRLKRDKVAMAGGIVIILLILIAILAPLIVKLLGHPPNEWH